jgi:anti-sigma factor ChrR (cupin superfamily)
MAEAINGDLSVRAVVDTTRMDWAPSPSASVWRKRVHLVGPPESGQVTSVVRYEPHSKFPAHDHPDGEEILVLVGASPMSMETGLRERSCSIRKAFVMLPFRIPAVFCSSS